MLQIARDQQHPLQQSRLNESQHAPMIFRRLSSTRKSVTWNSVAKNSHFNTGQLN
jgi:hypothetical protein